MSQTSEPNPGPGTDDDTQRNPNTPGYFQSQPAAESDEMTRDTMYDDTDDTDEMGEDEFDQEVGHRASPHDGSWPPYMPIPNWVTDGPMHAGRTPSRMDTRQEW